MARASGSPRRVRRRCGPSPAAGLVGRGVPRRGPDGSSCAGSGGGGRAGGGRRGHLRRARARRAPAAGVDDGGAGRGAAGRGEHAGAPDGVAAPAGGPAAPGGGKPPEGGPPQAPAAGAAAPHVGGPRRRAAGHPTGLRRALPGAAVRRCRRCRQPRHDDRPAVRLADHERLGRHVADVPVPLRGEAGDEPDQRDAARLAVDDPQQRADEAPAEPGIAALLVHDLQPEHRLAGGPPRGALQGGVEADERQPGHDLDRHVAGRGEVDAVADLDAARHVVVASYTASQGSTPRRARRSTRRAG